MSIFHKWSHNNGFSLSETKSLVNIFTRHNTPRKDHIRLGKFTLPYSNIVKYLGLILDQKLTWKPYIEYIVSKCNKGINFLKVISKTWWGAEPQIALLFYKTYIRSIIDYGCTLYGSASNLTLKKIDVVQNRALRVCIGAMNSTPVEPLRIESNEPPLVLRRQFLAEKSILSLKIKSSPLLDKIHQLSIEDLTNTFWVKKNSPPLCTGYRETTYLYSNLNHYYSEPQTIGYEDSFAKINILLPNYGEIPIISRKIFQNVIEQFQNYIHIYTDASKSEVGTGCAIFIPQFDFKSKIKLPKEMSIYSAEAYAILIALEFIKSSNLKSFVIFSDSMSVLLSISNYSDSISKKVHPFIRGIKHHINFLKIHGVHVQPIWVKAHTGILNNEEVDRLAKESVITGNPVEGMCFNDCLNVIKTSLEKKWDNYWKEYCFTTPTRYSQIQRDIQKEPWYFRYNIPRKYITTIIRLRFGHGCYPKHLYKIGILQSDTCVNCDKIGDLDHYFLECEIYAEERKEFYEDIIKLKIPAPFNLLHLLSLNDNKVIEFIINFLRKSNFRI